MFRSLFSCRGVARYLKQAEFCVASSQARASVFIAVSRSRSHFFGMRLTRRKQRSKVTSKWPCRLSAESSALPPKVLSRGPRTPRPTKNSPGPEPRPRRVARYLAPIFKMRAPWPNT